MTQATDGQVAILGGARTPFAKANGALADETPMSMGTHVAGHLRDEFALGRADPTRMSVLWGTSLSYARELYGGREIAVGCGLPAVNGHATEYACGTSVKTVVEGALMLRAGECDVALAGGSESLSHQPLIWSDEAERIVRRRGGPRHPDSVEDLLRLTMTDLLPAKPSIGEPYSGLTLAHYAETLMAEWGVTRAEADAHATRSHVRAAAARAQLATRILPIGPAGFATDDLIRADTTVEVLAGLPAVHEAGGVSSGNASRLTDGAGAVLLATDEWAEAHGHRPLGHVRSWALTAHDPDTGVLLGPAFAIPVALARAGLTLADLDVIDLHEAFAGQVLANLRALDSDAFAKEHLGHDRAVGALDPEQINRWGGSIGIGHPFGATGARLILQVLDQLEATGGTLGLLALCVGGARGAALVVERI